MKYTIIIILLIILPVILYANDGEYPGEGSSAVLFEFNQISLSNFKGGIGGKFFHSDSRAIRVGLTGSFHHRKDDREESRDLTDNSFSTGLRLGEFSHRNLRHNLLGYTGLEVTADYSRTKIEREENGAFHREVTRSILRGGIGPIFGIEYFLTNNISISGEYALRLTAMRSTEKKTPVDETITNRTTLYRAIIQTGGIFLAVYF